MRSGSPRPSTAPRSPWTAPAATPSPPPLDDVSANLSCPGGKSIGNRVSVDRIAALEAFSRNDGRPRDDGDERRRAEGADPRPVQTGYRRTAGGRRDQRDRVSRVSVRL